MFSSCAFVALVVNDFANGIVTSRHNLLTIRGCEAIVTVTEVPAMRRGVLLFVLILLVAVICASAVPPTDLPETSYNEVDTPVNQAPPVVSGIKFVRPTIVPVILPRQFCEALRSVDAQAHERKSAASVRHAPHSFQDLLCTFLI